MLRLLLCSGRSFDDEALVNNTLDDLRLLYGDLSINCYGGGVTKLARAWAKRNKVVYDEMVLFERPCDLLVAFGVNGNETPLRQAWKKRIPALKVLSIATYIRVGVGWKALLKQQRIKTRRK